jgi:hypothetical protein
VPTAFVSPVLAAGGVVELDGVVVVDVVVVVAGPLQPARANIAITTIDETLNEFFIPL